jgi:ATP-dependent helicase/DNAse subunit B
VAEALLQIIEAYSVETQPWDWEAKSKITEELQNIATVAHEDIRLEDALLRLQELIEPLRIGSSNSQPGHIHIAHYQQGHWIQRPYTFIVGVDNKRFPGQIKEDPILLDKERSNLFQELHLRSNRIKENMASMLQLLTSTKGRLILSYSAFDPVDNREVYPSTLLLHLYRLIIEKPNADYTELLT